MIGPGWADERSSPRPPGAREARLRRVAVVTGSHADFGLLEPVMRAVYAHGELELLVIAAGAHLIQPADTFREVKAAFAVADSVPMQIAGRVSRFDDAEAVGKGIARFARSFQRLEPDWVVVLGDRIEAFAAASAASIGGWAVAHIHGGDRAPGVADEAMRHAITKLAHLHLAATEESADRILRMGEPPERVHMVGSPAIDALAHIEPLGEEAFQNLGSPRHLLLMHPVGRNDEQEEHAASETLAALAETNDPFLAIGPNFDPGRRGILRAIESSGARMETRVPRATFVGLLRRLAGQSPGGDRGASSQRGALVGNSSAGLIEAPALGAAVVDIGGRQEGRQRPATVQHASENRDAIGAAIRRALGASPAPAMLYGDGASAERIAGLLASTDPHDRAVTRKLSAY